MKSKPPWNESNTSGSATLRLKPKPEARHEPSSTCKSTAAAAAGAGGEERTTTKQSYPWPPPPFQVINPLLRRRLLGMNLLLPACGVSDLHETEMLCSESYGWDAHFIRNFSFQQQSERETAWSDDALFFYVNCATDYLVHTPSIYYLCELRLRDGSE